MPKPVGELPEVAGLPNPFVFGDGSPVRTAEDWQRRRAELKRLFEDYMYGHLPPKPAKMTVERGDRVTDEANGVTIQELKLNLEHDGKTLPITVQIAWPTDATEKVPVIVQGAFGRRPGQGNASPPAPGERLKVFTGRGYAVAEVDFQQFAPDNRDRARGGGVYALFGDEIDCGALMAWAWGNHRVIDALQEVPEIDATKVVVTGHSRYGKAALVAGAFDERIAVTVPSHSGCAGAAPYRFIYGNSEQLHNIVGFAPHWFRPNFNQFVDNVNRLPVDQHLLKALVAPRPLLDTEGTQDSWTNPEGAQLTHLAAKRVYDFLGAGDKISIRYRPVGHVPSNEDLLEYADHVFFGKPLSEEFGKLPYSEEMKGFRWDAPK
jgi:endo-1,4-beta-xylanase